MTPVGGTGEVPEFVAASLVCPRQSLDNTVYLIFLMRNYPLLSIDIHGWSMRESLGVVLEQVGVGGLFPRFGG